MARGHVASQKWKHGFAPQAQAAAAGLPLARGPALLSCTVQSKASWLHAVVKESVPKKVPKEGRVARSPAARYAALGCTTRIRNKYALRPHKHAHTRRSRETFGHIRRRVQPTVLRTAAEQARQLGPQGPAAGCNPMRSLPPAPPHPRWTQGWLPGRWAQAAGGWSSEISCGRGGDTSVGCVLQC